MNIDILVLCIRHRAWSCVMHVVHSKLVHDTPNMYEFGMKRQKLVSGRIAYHCSKQSPRPMACELASLACQQSANHCFPTTVGPADRFVVAFGADAGCGGASGIGTSSNSSCDTACMVNASIGRRSTSSLPRTCLKGKGKQTYKFQLRC